MRGAFRVWEPPRWSLDRGAPAGEPVTVAQLKAHLRVDHADEDAALAGYLAAAREAVERMTGRALAARTMVWRISNFPPGERDELALPGGRTISVTSVVYDDVDGVSRTWASEGYEVDLLAEPARLRLAYDGEWPDVRDWALPVAITYLAGYAAAGDDLGANVPAQAKAAILLMAAELYARREMAVVGAPVAEAPLSVERLLVGLRVQRVA
jgi:uncharacterized phiE125 gp8 family phage protein